MKKTIRPAIFKWRQTEPEVFLCAVRWYLRYSLSFLDRGAAQQVNGSDVRQQIQFINQLFWVAA